MMSRCNVRYLCFLFIKRKFLDLLNCYLSHVCGYFWQFLEILYYPGFSLNHFSFSFGFLSCQGSAPTISIDNTGGCQLYLSKDSLEASITTAKSSEVNVLVPGAGQDDDWVCFIFLAVKYI